MTELSDKEKLMYNIMGAVSNSGVPLIYKGAMITKLLLLEHKFSAFSRETQDIDASWAGNRLPTMGALTAALNQALAPFAMKAIVKREYGERKSAGFNVVYESNGELAVSVDIDMRSEKGGRTYHYGGISFLGTTVDHILSDKIYVLSTEKAYRRAKDAVDVYALSHCAKVQTRPILDIWKEYNRTPGRFEALTARRADFEHAYSKLQRVEPKPDFPVLFNLLRLFLAPFVEMSTNNLAWDNNKQLWRDPSFFLQKLEVE
ncbi:MAG: nucleotidyl transferase AbiEii/AbiGii toxin family protein [Oscillospiraceae bacterium]|nr:nucleotidyl transferase AbiEii/AbiGii toxin family protein [Oscillospiraceae bacterium]